MMVSVDAGWIALGLFGLLAEAIVIHIGVSEVKALEHKLQQARQQLCDDERAQRRVIEDMRAEEQQQREYQKQYVRHLRKQVRKALRG